MAMLLKVVLFAYSQGIVSSRGIESADQAKHKQNPDPLHDKSDNKKKANNEAAVYRPADFHYDPATHTCVCPAGKTLG